MSERVECFFCSTPYKVFIAIEIVYLNNLVADLYIINRFSNAESLANRIRKLGIMRNVYLVEQDIQVKKARDSEKKSLKRKVLEAIHLFDLATKIKDYCDLIKLFYSVKEAQFIKDDLLYDTVYYSWGDPGIREIVYLYKYGNVREFVFYEDGLGSYCNPLTYRFSNMLRKITLSKFNYSVRLNDVSLFERLNKGFCYAEKKYSIKSIEKNDRMFDSIMNVFTEGRDCLIKQKFLVLDCVKEELLTIQGCNKNVELFEGLNHIIGKNNIIYKYHPRDIHAEYAYPHIELPNVPFECLCGMNDFTDKVIISVISTGAFTPKLLFDQEPIVVFLYKILEKYIEYPPEIATIFNELKKSYNDKSKVIIPENEEELYRVIKDLS